MSCSGDKKPSNSMDSRVESTATLVVSSNMLSSFWEAMVAIFRCGDGFLVAEEETEFHRILRVFMVETHGTRW